MKCTYFAYLLTGNTKLGVYRIRFMIGAVRGSHFTTEKFQAKQSKVICFKCTERSLILHWGVELVFLFPFRGLVRSLDDDPFAMLIFELLRERQI